MFFQDSLFGVLDPTVDHGFAAAERVALDDGAWIDHVPGWLDGAGQVFDELYHVLPWCDRSRVMFDTVVDEPRRTCWWSAASGSPEPLPLLADVRTLLSERYERAFDSIGFNLYRDGQDSVAWHGDRHRELVTDPVVAILSTGERRPLKVRPRGGGPARSWDLGDGDLFVMGGSCQHDWEHSVPKVRRGVGPRISVTFRHDAR